MKFDDGFFSGGYIKTEDDFFYDWYNICFPYCCYREDQMIAVLSVLKNFITLFYPGYKDKSLYVTSDKISDFEKFIILERLNVMDNLEYGTSPFVSFPTESGNNLFKYILSKNIDYLTNCVVSRRSHPYYETCRKTCCNCEDENVFVDEKCKRNPFF